MCVWRERVCAYTQVDGATGVQPYIYIYIYIHIHIYIYICIIYNIQYMMCVYTQVDGATGVQRIRGNARMCVWRERVCAYRDA